MSLAALTSYWALNLVQAGVVLLPGVARVRWLDALRSRWLLIAGPAAAVIALTFLPRVAAVLAADLSLLALIVVPPLAALGIAWAMRWRDLRLVPLIPVLVAVAWSAPDSPVGKSAALLLVALSCVALAVVVVAVVPRAVVKIGIVAWAAADLSLALAHGLVEASRAISQAAPPVCATASAAASRHRRGLDGVRGSLPRRDARSDTRRRVAEPGARCAGRRCGGDVHGGVPSLDERHPGNRSGCCCARTRGAPPKRPRPTAVACGC
jgi:hypothetical protein